MDDVKRRVLGYGTGALLVVGLTFGALYEADPDAETLIGAVEFQIRLAHGMPSHDKDGRELSARVEMLDDAEAQLDLVEKQKPGLPITAEYRAFIQSLRGDYHEAALSYRSIRESGNYRPDQLPTVIFQESRMLAKAGDLPGALRVLEQHTGGLDQGLRDRAEADAAELLWRMDRPADAHARLQGLVQQGADRPMAAVIAGHAYHRHGEKAAAEAAWQAAAGDSAEATFWLARLKLDQGEVDTALDLLGHAHASDAELTRALILKDRDAWQPVADEGAFQRALGESGTPATPGR